jgi:stearoyl-CoA desaturase (Delta-9 desaturase)
VIHWYLSLFSQTFFDHRYASHRAFTMSKFWERVFYIFAYITQGSSYLSPRAYAVMHRMHHAYTDTEKDPHSPKYFSNVFSMMWHTRNVFAGIYNKTISTEKQFHKNVPQWPAFDKIASSAVSKICWVIVYLAFYILFASSPWLFLLLPFTILIGPLQGAIINWFAHKYGYINFKQKNTSRNLLPVDIFMLGESYHNDHHQHPSSANFGVRWFEIDPVYYIILLFSKLRIVRLSPQASIASGKSPVV